MTTNLKASLVLAFIVLAVFLFLLVSPNFKRQPIVASFADCAEFGNPILETYPRQCKTPDGRTFTEQLPTVATSTADLSDLIIVDSPKPNSTVHSPLVVSGKARGTWYFEAVFPVELKQGDQIIASGQAHAKSDWMTSDFVPFEATLDFSNIKWAVAEPVTLVLKKDNPSGLPQNDKSLSIPLVTNPQKMGTSTAFVCRPTGCSGEICSDKPLVSNCIYSPVYACYKNANCARQSSGQCGWTQTPELIQCLDSAKNGGIIK